MNRKFTQPLAVIGILFLLAVLIGATVSIPNNSGKVVSKTSKTFASAQVDTVKVNREAGMSGLSFMIHTKDSSNFDNVVVYRVFDGVCSPYVTNDSLIGYAKDSSASERTIIKTITLAPLADAYWVVVKYNTDDGGLNQGTTTPTVVYGVGKQFSRVNRE